MKANTVSETKVYIVCPHCNKGKTSISHLLEEKRDLTFGPWFCDDCGKSFNGEIKNDEVFVEKRTRYVKDVLVFMRNGNLLIAVKGYVFDDDYKNLKYYYEEHTCPVNYFKTTEAVIDINDRNTDPHGLFRFVGATPYQDLLNCSIEEIEAIVAQLWIED